jgi:hypothetical protein
LERSETIKSRAYSLMYGSLLALFVFASMLNFVLPPIFLGIPKFVFIAIVVGIIWLVVLAKFLPRCPQCGLGVFSYFEIAKIPVIVRSWVGSNCSRCGEKYS